MNPALIGSPQLTFNSSVNVVWDGNSLVQGQGSSGGQTLPVQVAGLAPMVGSGSTYVNRGIGGQAWSGMISSPSDVDSSWVTGKTNVLILWETTNAVFNDGGSGAQSISQMQSYITARRAVHPWIVLVLTSIPRESGSTVTNQTTRDERNGQMVAFDTTLKSNSTALGVDRVVDVRQAGSPFAFANYLPASFDATQTYWSEVGSNRIHLTNAGYAVIAGYVADALRRLPRKAR